MKRQCHTNGINIFLENSSSKCRFFIDLKQFKTICLKVKRKALSIAGNIQNLVVSGVSHNNEFILFTQTKLVQIYIGNTRGAIGSSGNIASSNNSSKFSLTIQKKLWTNASKRSSTNPRLGTNLLERWLFTK